jgi:hypothetical protein
MNIENLSLKEIEEAIQFKRKFEAEQEQKEQPEKINVWTKVRKSKHWDFVVNIGISVAICFVAYFLPKYLLDHWTNISAELGSTIIEISLKFLKFFSARICVDTSFYFNENLFYQFIKRNGNNSFDYQEDLKKLDTWHKVLITTLKYIAYLLLYALL